MSRRTGTDRSGTRRARTSGAARRVVAGAVVAGAALLGGCASPVLVPVAPDADDPTCAEVVLTLPAELAGLERRTTTSQASAAWGEPGAAVVLRCGVEPPGPTTQECVTADDGTVAVDWIAVPDQPADDGSADGSAAWTFTTYGRVPAVEVHVPAAVTAARSTSFLIDLGAAVARAPQDARCLGPADLPAADAAGASGTPGADGDGAGDADGGATADPAAPTDPAAPAGPAGDAEPAEPGQPAGPTEP